MRDRDRPRKRRPRKRKALFQVEYNSGPLTPPGQSSAQSRLDPKLPRMRGRLDGVATGLPHARHRAWGNALPRHVHQPSHSPERAHQSIAHCGSHRPTAEQRSRRAAAAAKTTAASAAALAAPPRWRHRFRHARPVPTQRPPWSRMRSASTPRMMLKVRAADLSPEQARSASSSSRST